MLCKPPQLCFVASESVAGVGSQFSQLQSAKPANHIIDCELHLMTERDVTQMFHVLHSTLLLLPFTIYTLVHCIQTVLHRAVGSKFVLVGPFVGVILARVLAALQNN